MLLMLRTSIALIVLVLTGNFAVAADGNILGVKIVELDAANELDRIEGWIKTFPKDVRDEIEKILISESMDHLPSTV